MSPPPDQATAIRDSLSRLSKDELLELAKSVTLLEQRLQIVGPKTDDELHAWVVETFGLDIPRAAVCDDHDAPFKFFADCYFHRTNSALAMANRGGSKTFLVALLHLINSKFKARCEGATIGAIEAQAKRAYAHLLRLLDQVPELKENVSSSLISETKWKNGSRVEILPGTMAAVNGPHPNIVHADEVELMDEEVYDESRNMSVSSFGIPAQDIITSTRKRAIGLMQRLIDERNEAVANNRRSPYDLYQWCVYETAANVSNCQVAKPDHPNPCQCDLVVKGRWDSGELRRFSDCCRGRLAQSCGWMPLSDLHKTFMADSRDIWEAQQECIRPSTEGMVLPRFSLHLHGLKDFEPDPNNGPIFAGLDFGGTNPHAAIYMQLLRYEIFAKRIDGSKIRLREGSIVAFDEIYEAEIGNQKFADLIVTKEERWARRFENFKVMRRFPDPQGKAARLDLLKHKPPLQTHFVTTRDVKEHIKEWRNLIDDESFYVVSHRCKMFCEEISGWHYPKKKLGMIDDPEIPVNDFDHLMSASRYAISNIMFMERRNRLPHTRRDGDEPRKKRQVLAATGPRYVSRTAMTR